MTLPHRIGSDRADVWDSINGEILQAIATEYDWLLDPIRSYGPSTSASA
jgi:hypothetical protein